MIPCTRAPRFNALHARRRRWLYIAGVLAFDSASALNLDPAYPWTGHGFINNRTNSCNWILVQPAVSDVDNTDVLFMPPATQTTVDVNADSKFRGAISGTGTLTKRGTGLKVVAVGTSQVPVPVPTTLPLFGAALALRVARCRIRA